MTTHLIYHGGCYDGFGAAWAAWLRDPTVKLHAAFYGDDPPDVEPGDAVIIADFSYDLATTERLAKACDYNLTILDHHKSAQAELGELEYATFDMDKSGAMLAWEFFHCGKPAPTLIQYVQDRDLWLFALPQSKAVSAMLGSYPKDFVTWNWLQGELEADFAGIASEGEAILRAKKQQVESMCENALELQVFADGQVYDVPVVNASCFFSEVGNRLCQMYPDAPFAAYYFDRGDGRRQWGLRSIGDFDVSEVAKAHGGGGHKNAAGYTTEIPQ